MKHVLLLFFVFPLLSLSSRLRDATSPTLPVLNTLITHNNRGFSCTAPHLQLESKHTAAEKKLEKQAYRIHHLCRNVQQLHSAATNDAGATIGFPGMVPTGHTQYSWTGPLAEAGAGWLPSQS